MRVYPDKSWPGNPWTPTYLIVVSMASVLAMAVVCSRNVSVPVVSIVAAAASVLLAVLAWNEVVKERTGSIAYVLTADPHPSRSKGRMWIYLLLSAVIAGAGLIFRSAPVLHWVVVYLPLILILLFSSLLRNYRYGLLIVAPLLSGCLFLGAGALLGDLKSGGYPATFALLFTFIIHATHQLERYTEVSEGDDEDPHVHIIHRKPLAWLSIAFFLFGVVDFWPWLGKTYGNAYFWVLVVGVLVPLLYLWGRLRQPRRQNSYVALQRFNRVVPYLALIVLVAIVLG